MKQSSSISAVVWISVTASLLTVVALVGCVELVKKHPVVKPVLPVTLLLSGETNGLLEPCRCSERQLGGISRRAGLIKSIAATQQPNTLVLDNGDVVSTMGRQEELKYETAIMSMNQMGCVAMGVGEGDLTLGLDYLAAMQEVARFPFLCANLLRDGQRVFPSHFIGPVNGVAAAIVGVLSPKFDGRVRRLDPRLRVAPIGAEFGALLDTFATRFHVVIALAHMPMDEGVALAKQFPQLDVVVCGHGVDEPLAQPKKVGKTLILSTGTKGRYLVRLDIVGRTEAGLPVGRYEAIRLLPELQEHPDVATFFAEYVDIVKNENLLNETRRLDPPKGVPYAGSDMCQFCHEAAYDIWRKSAHAKALDTLQHLTPRRDEDPECVVCHVVGFPHKTGFESQAKTPKLAGVGCESCHGPGWEHIRNPEKPYRKSAERECLTCHTADQSPGFSYRKHFAKIKH